MVVFKKSVRHQKKLKMGIVGPSGSGKTYSSLLLARGIAGETGKIAVIDSENKSSELYADLTDFDVAIPSEKVSVDEMDKMIKGAIAAGYDVLVIDSITPVWRTLLELHEKYTRQTGNSFTAWNKVTPEYTRFINLLVYSDIHILFTIRAKTQYEVVIDSNQKAVPKKLGIGPVFRQGIDYEPDVALDMTFDGKDNYAIVSKTRINILPMGHEFIPTIEMGAKLQEWISGGEIEEKEEEEVLSETTYEEEIEELW